MTTTKQDIEKLRNENKEYKKKLLDDRALNEIQQNDIREWISSNNRQIEDMEKRITELTILEKQHNLELIRTQGKSAASTDSLLKFRPLKCFHLPFACPFFWSLL